MKNSYGIFKENRIIQREEERRQRQAFKTSGLELKAKLEEKIPAKIYGNLKKAFSKSFEIVFEKGVGIIEKTYNRDELIENHQAFDNAIQIKAGRSEFRSFQKYVKSSGMKNMLISTAEGSVLGALGIGMPDILIFTGMLLKGAYETSLNYGYDYNDPWERYFILQLMEASLAKGEEYVELNNEINNTIKTRCTFVPSDEEMKEQIQLTSNAMATDMLIMKFVQGLPILGVIGGVANPIYYKRIIGYIQLKYRRRYLRQVK